MNGKSKKKKERKKIIQWKGERNPIPIYVYRIYYKHGSHIYSLVSEFLNRQGENGSSNCDDKGGGGGGGWKGMKAKGKGSLMNAIMKKRQTKIRIRVYITLRTGKES